MNLKQQIVKQLIVIIIIIVLKCFKVVYVNLKEGVAYFNHEEEGVAFFHLGH